MKRVTDLVDELGYTMTNCFAHQLFRSLRALEGVHVETVELGSLNRIPRSDVVVSRLRLRTLARVAPEIGRRLTDVPFAVYEQDPWESYKANSPHIGSYDFIVKHVPQARFFVTSRWWADYLVNRGIDASYVEMWMMPEYCDAAPTWSKRPIDVGFYGSIHPRRQRLFDELSRSGIKVEKRTASDYATFLAMLSQTRVFVHDEHEEIVLDDGTVANMSSALWVKDIEAASRGCWSVRNSGHCDPTYLDSVETVLTYERIDRAIDAIRSIFALDPDERQARCDRTVDHIRSSDRWRSTARSLVGA